MFLRFVPEILRPLTRRGRSKRLCRATWSPALTAPAGPRRHQQQSFVLDTAGGRKSGDCHEEGTQASGFYITHVCRRKVWLALATFYQEELDDKQGLTMLLSPGCDTECRQCWNMPVARAPWDPAGGGKPPRTHKHLAPIQCARQHASSLSCCGAARGLTLFIFGVSRLA